MSRDRRAFMRTPRVEPPTRPVDERVGDFAEVETSLPLAELHAQAARCMGCGVPFCHQGCPLGNEIPAWNELVARAERDPSAWRNASDRLHATNNFPEITGKICPAPCERACVLDLGGAAVTVRSIESAIASRAFAEGWVEPRPPATLTGRSVAIIGSGPAGLAAAQQLRRVGHDVVVYDRAPRAGGLLRYGIPDFKLDRGRIDARLAQIEAEGVRFVFGVEVGRDIEATTLLTQSDAVLLAIGAEEPRALGIPGETLPGVFPAMEFLIANNRAVAGDDPTPAIDAAGKRVVILGGGDTGADCLGTALRQGAAEVHHFHYKPAPGGVRAETPWPWAPMTYASSSHDEGGERGWNLLARSFEGDGRLQQLRCERVDWPMRDGKRVLEPLQQELLLEVDIALIAVGFVGVRGHGWLDDLGVERDGSGRVRFEGRYRSSNPKVYVAGDARRGASLVVHAIAEGRGAARAIDLALMGSTTLTAVDDDEPLDAPIFGFYPGR